MLTIDEALQFMRDWIRPVEVEEFRLSEALGLVLASDATNPADSPPFDKAMMDGFAVRAADIREQGTALRIIEDVMAGQSPQRRVGPGEATRIMTGAPVPEGADAVVPIEWTSASGSEVSIEPRTIRPEQNVLRKGHVRRAGSLLVRAGTRLRPQEIGSLAEAGHAIVPAYRRPRVAIVPTGDELVPIDEVPGPGQIRNSNEVMLTAQIQSYGADALPLGIARDNAEHLQALIQEGLKADVLILSGGVSAGQLDLVPQELKRAGVEQVFHKIRLRPGKPLWFGVRPAGATAGAANPCYVFGLPGNPVSSMVCCELFVRTALGWLSGDSAAKFEQVAARLAETATNPTDRPTMHPARLSAEAGQLSVQVMEWKGSADLHALVEANALAAMPAGPTTLEAGETIPVIPLAGSKPW